MYRPECLTADLFSACPEKRFPMLKESGGLPLGRQRKFTGYRLLHPGTVGQAGPASGRKGIIAVYGKSGR